MKKCYKCKKEKRRIDFNFAPAATDGLSHICRECAKIESKERRQRIKEGTIEAF